MLTQENDEGLEQPIAFFSKGVEEYEQRYSFVEKYVLAVVKSLKKFKHLLTHSKVHLKVTHPSVKEFLLSKDLNEKRAGWITKVMEYDIDIQTTKLVRGRGLCEYLARDENLEETKHMDASLVMHSTKEQDKATSWLPNMINYLKIGQCPIGLDSAKRRYYILQSISFVLINDILFRKDHNGVLLRCIDSEKIGDVLFEFHDGPSGDHFSPITTAYKIMRARYYWPSIFKDSHDYVRKCIKRAMFVGKERLAALPLQPIRTE